MLKLSKAQYKQLCADCAAEMMRGAGHGGKIPDFSGTDMTFYVIHECDSDEDEPNTMYF